MAWTRSRHGSHAPRRSRFRSGSVLRTGPAPIRDISEFADKKLRRRLESINGVGQVLIVGGRPRQIDPCPMSAREIDVLRRLARGMVYKQIASELGLSTSTVRTHLHNVYGKLGAMDRAQAVLIATERGWI